MEKLQANIRSWYKQANLEQKKKGKAWYSEAHALCRKLAEYHGLTTEQVAGILAALSPVCAWEANLLGLFSIIKTGMMPSIRTYPKNVIKAVRILNGEKPSLVLGGNKVKNFYASILRPHSNACCIDRHAAALATKGEWGAGKPVTPKQYKILFAAYQAEAKRLRTTTATLQATVWTVYRDSLRKEEKNYTQKLSLWE